MSKCVESLWKLKTFLLQNALEQWPNWKPCLNKKRSLKTTVFSIYYFHDDITINLTSLKITETEKEGTFLFDTGLNWTPAK